MSQAGLNNTTEGPVPPEVATSYVTDDGTAIPSSNVLNVLGGFDALNSRQDMDGGIVTFADPDLSNNLYISRSNIFSDTSNTLDDSPVTLSFFALSPVGTYITRIDVVAYDLTHALSATFSIFAGIRSDGVLATLINPSDPVANIDPDVPLDRLAGINAIIDVAGISLAVTLTGVAATSINWKIIGTYQFVGETI